MPDVKPTKLEIIDVYEGAKLVKSLNTEQGATAAAQEFADWWEGGIIRQALDSSAPAPSDEDKEKIVNRVYLDTLTFKRRYVGGDGRKAYPEDAPDARREGYRDTTMQLRGAINNLCSTAWTRGEERKRAELKEQAERLAITDADRYAEGLKLVDRLTAMDTLRDRISGIKNDTVRRHLMAEFPELYGKADADAAADAHRMESYEADVSAWRQRTTGQPMPHESIGSMIAAEPADE